MTRKFPICINFLTKDLFKLNSISLQLFTIQSNINLLVVEKMKLSKCHACMIIIGFELLSLSLSLSLCLSLSLSLSSIGTPHLNLKKKITLYTISYSIQGKVVFFQIQMGSAYDKFLISNMSLFWDIYSTVVCLRNVEIV